MSTKREPMLTDEAIQQWSRVSAQTSAQRKATAPHTNTNYALGAKAARDHYENLIASGELRIVRKPTLKYMRINLPEHR